MKRSEKNALEACVKVIVDEFVMGKIDTQGLPLTATKIAYMIRERFDPKASPGGVHNILTKWVRLGFIVPERDGARPLAFGRYTDDARDLGLARLKEREAQRKKHARAMRGG